MPFKNEDDVRNWVRREHRHKLILWVEAAIGGTDGYPDATIIDGGKVRFRELKVGEMTDDGWLEFEMANAQRIVLRRIAAQGGDAGVIVGELGGDRLWLVAPYSIQPKRPKTCPTANKVLTRIMHQAPPGTMQQIGGPKR